MGKGDRKTAKGKRTIGAFGNSRPHKKRTVEVAKSSDRKKD